MAFETPAGNVQRFEAKPGHRNRRNAYARLLVMCDEVAAREACLASPSNHSPGASVPLAERGENDAL